MSTLHPAQATILRELLFHNGSPFAALNKTDLTSDQFTFHLKQLIKAGFITKRGRLYFLSQPGKQFASKLDVDALQMEKFGTPSVAVTAKRIINGQVHYLIHRRRKEPFYGFYGFVNGKIRFGESTAHTATRELHEETRLTGEPTLLLVTHRLNGVDPDHIKLDHYFFFYLIKNPQGELVDSPEGANFWKTLDEIRTLQVFPGLDKYFPALETETPGPFFEYFIQMEEI